MAVVIKTSHDKFTKSETRIPLNQDAKDALVLGALIGHGRKVYGHPTFGDLAKLIHGSKQTGRVHYVGPAHYGFIEFTDDEIMESLKRLERSDYVETYVKKIHEDSGELSYKPLIGRDC